MSFPQEWELCPNCKARFRFPVLMMRTVHGEGREYQCPICGFKMVGSPATLRLRDQLQAMHYHLQDMKREQQRLKGTVQALKGWNTRLRYQLHRAKVGL